MKNSPHPVGAAEPVYSITSLKNGVRIASVHMPAMHTVTVGIWAAVGARHESAEQSGLSHFVEHLLFKGTRRRTARQISEAVEGIGGYLNAFTGEDHTCYYARAATRHFPVLCDVLVDMFRYARFAPSDIARERGVIHEEILMYKDQPAHRAQELLGEIMWPNHPLGRPITGTPESIDRLRRPDFTRFVANHYTGCNTIAAVAGPVTHAETLDILQPLLDSLPRGVVPRPQPFRGARAGCKIRAGHHDCEQLNLSLGFPCFGRRDRRRFALRLLNVILGENMSSRLFQQVRERHGYCYSIQSSLALFAETGLVNISAGIDPAHPRDALRIVFREIQKLRDKPPARSELRKAQDYAVGQMLMGLESTTSQMMWMAESLLGHGRILRADEIERRLLAVAPADLQEVARTCLEPRMARIAVAGPVDGVESVRGWLPW